MNVGYMWYHKKDEFVLFNDDGCCLALFLGFSIDPIAWFDKGRPFFSDLDCCFGGKWERFESKQWIVVVSLVEFYSDESDREKKRLKCLCIKHLHPTQTQYQQH